MGDYDSTAAPMLVEKDRKQLNALARDCEKLGEKLRTVASLFRPAIVACTTEPTTLDRWAKAIREFVEEQDCVDEIAAKREGPC